MSKKSPVAILSTEVARKIAAGEVIDRPNAVVRELMDNAVDSGADAITVEISGGGIDRVCVIDNGQGMTKEDLSICASPHATSKIKTEMDLLKLSTLGFRGEALMSCAAVAKLEIKSGDYIMQLFPGEKRSIKPSSHLKGTIVSTQGLFENFPARRVFLKRKITENTLCQRTFIEKVIPRCDIGFRLFVDGRLKYNFEKGQTPTKRFCQAVCPEYNPALFYELEGHQKENWSYTLIIGEPGVSRNDKKGIYIYVNSRRIQEYSLSQALESGVQGYFPNGTHPIVALFATIRPDCVDFNIHPAKKEVRIKDISGLHHNIYCTLKDFFKEYTQKSSFAQNSSKNDIGISTDMTFLDDFDDMKNPSFSPLSKTNAPFPLSQMASSALEENDVFDVPKTKDTMMRQQESDDFSYIGQCLGTFLIAQKGDIVYFIDQHAAHERIRYNKIIEDAANNRQNLLVPYIITTQNEEQDEYLVNIREQLCLGGYNIQNCGKNHWEVTCVPAMWQGTQEELQNDILEKKLCAQDTIRALAATAACRGAVKDKEVLDSVFATNLAKKALELADPHCPHGRPIWFAISRLQLFSLVKRT